MPARLVPLPGLGFAAGDFQARSTIAAIDAADDNRVISITTAQNGTQIAAATASATNSYVLVFNSTTGRGEIWFDTDWSNTGNRTQVATLDNVTTLAALTAITNADIVVYNSATDPIILDLDHNGYTFSTLENGVQFDINADGIKDQVAWNTSGDGILAIDLNHDGVINDGTEIFTPDFAGGHFASGSAALASLDTNHDGLIDFGDEAFDSLVIWKDANADGITDAGELSSLADNGIASISAPGTPTDGIIDGQTITAEGVVTHTDGSTSGYVEVGLDTTLGDDSSAFSWDNLVVGDAGVVDTLHGTAGADQFVLTDLAAVDLIADYDTAQGDSVDLSALLGGSGANADNAGEFVKYQGNTLQVDVDGAGTAHDFVDVAVLNQPTADVRIVLDDGVDVTVNHLI